MSWRGYGGACRIVLKFQGQLEASISSRVRSGSLRGSKRVWWKQVEQHGGWWEVGITIVLKAMWRLLEFCLENSENQKTGKTSSSRAPGARSRLEMPVDSVCWRGARAGWRRAQAESADPFFVQILWKNLFQRVSVLDSVLFYKIDLFLIFRHVFFYK